MPITPTCAKASAAWKRAAVGEEAELRGKGKCILGNGGDSCNVDAGCGGSGFGSGGGGVRGKGV